MWIFWFLSTQISVAKSSSKWSRKIVTLKLFYHLLLKEMRFESSPNSWFTYFNQSREIMVILYQSKIYMGCFSFYLNNWTGHWSWKKCFVHGYGYESSEFTEVAGTARASFYQALLDFTYIFFIIRIITMLIKIWGNR